MFFGINLPWVNPTSFRADKFKSANNYPQNIRTRNIGCVRLGNPDLDFQNLDLDFPIEREIRKRISPPRNPSSGWISIKKPKSGFFWISLFVVRLGNPKKDLQNCSREQRSSFY